MYVHACIHLPARRTTDRAPHLRTGLPCERCWVQNLPCRLKQRQRRLPKAKRRKGEDADAAREVLAAAMTGPPVAVVLATANVKANAEAYLQAFHRVSASG